MLARLSDRNPCRIVCHACGNGLAWVFSTVDLSARDLKHLRRPSPPRRHVLMPEGWAPDKHGVWRPTSRARRQLRRGYPIRNRRLTRIARDRTEARTDGEGRPFRPRAGNYLRVLPADAVCAYCSMRQTLDGRELMVTAASGGPLESEPGLRLYPGATPVQYFLISFADGPQPVTPQHPMGPDYFPLPLRTTGAQ